MALHGVNNTAVDRKTELAGESHGSKHTDRILAKTLPWITYQHQPLTFHILEAARVIPNAKISDVVVQRIAGEIAPPDILIDRAVDIVSKDTAFLIVGGVVVFMIRGSPESGDLNDLPTKTNMRQPESTPYQAAIAELRADLLGRGVGRYIEVLGMQLQHGIAHTTADQKCLVTRLMQSIQDFQCGLGYLVSGDVVGGAGNYLERFGPVIRALFQIITDWDERMRRMIPVLPFVRG